jgi:hypothetical protein
LFEFCAGYRLQSSLIRTIGLRLSNVLLKAGFTPTTSTIQLSTFSRRGFIAGT